MYRNVIQLRLQIPKKDLCFIGIDLAEVYSEVGFGSKSHIRRMILQGAVKLNDVLVVTDPLARLFSDGQQIYLIERKNAG